MEPPNLAPSSYWGELGKALGHQSFQIPLPFHRGLFPVLPNSSLQVNKPARSCYFAVLLERSNSLQI